MRKLNNSQVQQDTHLEELAALGRKEVAHYGHFPSGQAYMEHVNSNTIVIVQLEDIEVLENIDGIDLFASGPQDIAQSMGLPGQPNHLRVKEFEDTTCLQSWEKMADDVTSTARAT